MRTRDDLLSAAEGAVKRALSLGADAADAFVQQTRAVRIAAFGGFVNPLDSLDEGFGIRVVVDGRPGMSGSSSLEDADDAIRTAIQSARQSARAKETPRFAGPLSQPLRPLPLDPRLASPDSERLSAAAQTAMDAALRARDVTYAEASLRSWHREVAVANSNGLVAADASVGERLEMEIRVTRGATDRSATEVWNGARGIEGEVDLGALAAGAVERARFALDAQPLGAPVDAVILGPAPMSQVLGIFANALNGRVARAGQSPLSASVGRAVAAPIVDLADEPHGPVGAGHRAMDDEGTPTRRTPFLARGVLGPLMLDAETAGADGAATGHAHRQSASGGVLLRPNNLVLAAGDATMDDLMAQAGRAVLVEEAMMGAFTANHMTGDFSLVVPFAVLVEGGKVRHALPPTTLGGNVHRVLREARALGRATRTYQGGTSPAALTGGVTCAT